MLAKCLYSYIDYFTGSLKLAFIKWVAAASKKAQLFGLNANADTDPDANALIHRHTQLQIRLHTKIQILTRRYRYDNEDYVYDVWVNDQNNSSKTKKNVKMKRRIHFLHNISSDFLAYLHIFFFFLHIHF